jgi:hypothetical protein
MNGFDKFCAALAFALAIVFLILGVIGLFAGSSANFSLPPVLGGIPGLVGWGIFRSVRVAWSVSRPPAPTDLRSGFPVMPAGSIQQTRSPAENPYNDPS